MRAGMPTKSYQASVSAFGKKGYRWTHLDVSSSGLEVNGKFVKMVSFYQGSWEKRRGPAQRARHGLTLRQFRTVNKMYRTQGFRVVIVEGYNSAPKQPRFAALWEKRGGPARKVFLALSSRSYQRVFRRYTKLGYRLTHISGSMAANTTFATPVPRYSVIFEKRQGPAWVAHHRMTPASYAKKNAALKAQGFGLVHIDLYNELSRQKGYINAIWEKRSVSRSRVVVPLMREGKFEEKGERLIKAGYRTTALSCFYHTNRYLCSGVWTRARKKGAPVRKRPAKGRVKDRAPAPSRRKVRGG